MTRAVPAPTSGTRPGAGHGYCLDLDSKLVADAIAGLGKDSNGGDWNPQGASEQPLKNGCGLDFVRVLGSGVHDATVESRVLLFADGRFLGTVEPKPYSYTTIDGHTKNSVTVSYRWLRKDDAFAAPTGGPTKVTVTWDGQRLHRAGSFPPASGR
ncbi:LppP/LprE family lipoprotein [Tsukamurella sp. 8F]|uniref:LppP/LprE family lipoprotein n=1 Tax=unclassified Tsukamurella TaxID=2633480 RepID=UPI0023B8E3D7|nr:MULTISPECIES: LppP/LprE family lipoprotein [unclassified Tsukamurella]MDF0528837.1 LppP/LprE family lipoprotein [Tsukamurella sp. 8J]MDF0586672.1 LppP/LprE family lipoprotein [Tsukamurella sp. 8F]